MTVQHDREKNRGYRPIIGRAGRADQLLAVHETRIRTAAVARQNGCNARTSTCSDGDQANAALAAVPIPAPGALLAAWEDQNPNIDGHCQSGNLLMSLIVTDVHHL